MKLCPASIAMISPVGVPKYCSVKLSDGAPAVVTLASVKLARMNPSPQL